MNFQKAHKDIECLFRVDFALRLLHSAGHLSCSRLFLSIINGLHTANSSSSEALTRIKKESDNRLRSLLYRVCIAHSPNSLMMSCLLYGFDVMTKVHHVRSK